jgi:CBS-domain-containing membrane protein
MTDMVHAMSEQNSSIDLLRYRRNAGRMLWCMCGAAAGISLALALAGPQASPFLLASMGGSAVFLFGLTRAPAAQPRALFGGHLSGALIGIACYQFFGDALWVCALAQALTLACMLLAKTVHPPAGANPLIMIHSHAGFAALWQPVFVGVAALAAVAFVWSRLVPGLARYPAMWLEKSPPSTFWGGWND